MEHPMSTVLLALAAQCTGYFLGLRLSGPMLRTLDRIKESQRNPPPSRMSVAELHRLKDTRP